jgi:hypothetical protein
LRVPLLLIEPLMLPVEVASAARKKAALQQTSRPTLTRRRNKETGIERITQRKFI